MRKILIILPHNLGDVIMALPVLRALKKADPEVHISFMVEEGYDGGLEHSPFCDTIIPFQRKAFKALLSGGQWREGLNEFNRFIEEMNTCGFREVINLTQMEYASFLTTLVRASSCKGRHFLPEGNHVIPDLWSQYLYAIPFARTCNMLHATDVYQAIAGVSPSVSSEKLITIQTDEKTTAAVYLRSKGYDSTRRYVLLQPGAAYATKRWPAQHFIALGKLLTSNGWGCIITGAPAEREIAETIAEGIGRGVIVTAGMLTFRQTIAVCSFAHVAVSGDTALMHAASAVGVKVIALFGPTNPVETGPYGEGHCVLSGTCEQKPCFKTVCARMDCMKSITPEMVFKLITGSMIVPGLVHLYTTHLDSCCWSLQPFQNDVVCYYNPSWASMIRAVFDTASSSPEDVDQDTVENVTLFANYCEQMERTLTLFRTSRNGIYLQQFEELREVAASLGGCALFLNAVLNIKLNSVPLFDPDAGIAASVNVCNSTATLIRKALAG